MIIVVIVLMALAATGCVDETEDTVTADGGDRAGSATPEADSDETGTVQVQLEPVEGVFIEGFEIGLRFETGEGEVIAATLWSDFVKSTGATDIDAYYQSVFRQPVPTGTVLVQAEVNIGIGPAPEVPDLNGELPCELAIEVGPGTESTVEVSFDDTNDCLRIVTGATASQSKPSQSIPTTSSTMPVPPSLEVGTSHYVDVDLECQAFELGGIWVLVDGDTSTWQPPGERHEGGTFTIESPGRGQFVGDAQGHKTATFERIDHTIEPPCTPLPRPSP